MHFLLILLSLAIALGLRWLWAIRGAQANGVAPEGASEQRWNLRWQRAWFCLVAPAAMLVMTAIAILLMGPKGQMVWGWEGWATDIFAFSFLGFSLFCLGESIWDAWQTLKQTQHYQMVPVQGQQGRYVNSSVPFAACIGFWHSELLVSRGLLELLSPEQIDAVLIHEQAHQNYRDTFWFFWWGWLKRMTRWLPKSTALWNELLVLRELRADRWASQRTDGLLLAESLVLMVQSPASSTSLCAPFGETTSENRLAERINALLASPSATGNASPQENTLPSQFLWACGCCFLALLPLLSVPFHY